MPPAACDASQSNSTPTLHLLITDMFDTMRAADGAGLAALLESGWTCSW
jgi:peptide deformylase